MRYQGTMAKLALTLGALLRQDMSLERLTAFDTTTTGFGKPFGRASIALNFWHFNSPLPVSCASAR